MEGGICSLRHHSCRTNCHRVRILRQSITASDALAGDLVRLLFMLGDIL
ncbi:hypothetical protein HanIR_Chr10g0460111 [Helianthus annuus]|nr:hypothetical protein HanIR_Chr10g0460111 [Helianthus annuus]